MLLPRLFAALSAILLSSSEPLRPWAEGPRLTLGDLVSSTSSSPVQFDIPLNPEASDPNKQVKPIPLPVFDPNITFEYPPDENRARFMEMPPDAFHIEFDKDHPPEWNDTKGRIDLDLGKFVNKTHVCGFCLVMVEKLKEEIGVRGIDNFTQTYVNNCEEQKDIGQAKFSCDLINKIQVERLNKEDADDICISEKTCSDKEETAVAAQVMKDEAVRVKEEDEFQNKMKIDKEQRRRIVEAQEEIWRRDFKRTHNDSAVPTLVFNTPEAVEGSGEESKEPKAKVEFGHDPREELIEKVLSHPAESEATTEGGKVDEEAAEVKDRLKVALEQAKNAEKEEIGFISKPVVRPSRPDWTSGPRVDLVGGGVEGKGEEEAKKEEAGKTEATEKAEETTAPAVEEHTEGGEEGTTTEPTTTTVAPSEETTPTVEEATTLPVEVGTAVVVEGQEEGEEEEEKFPAPIKAPIQCSPPKEQKPSTSLSTDEEKAESVAVGGQEAGREEEGPGQLTRPVDKQQPRIFNREVKLTLHVTDIA